MKEAYTAEDFLNGEVLLVDKPYGWTSFDVVNKIRYKLTHFVGKKMKVGHAGTLDPLATGLLILCTGKFTKKLMGLQAEAKEYTGTIAVGATTPSQDLETEIDQRFPISHITKEAIEEATKGFIGEIDQVPPVFSAKRVEGTRSYELARKGEAVEMPPSRVTINEFEITGVDFLEDTIDVHFKVACSKGTYIRSIARDFGEALNSGGHLKALRRTASGDFKIEDATTVDDFHEVLFGVRPDGGK